MLLLTEEQNQPVGGVAGYSEAATSRWVANGSPGETAARIASSARPVTQPILTQSIRTVDADSWYELRELVDWSVRSPVELSPLRFCRVSVIIAA
ncbi:hypothetical protein GCM10009727_71850 [Actinomadura napierensis]|uniref:Uncharacterized protein n=1 Tax=Actinomadura napierensis TaxID=267854 RepID=A0ABP5M1Z7_9ACTN